MTRNLEPLVALSPVATSWFAFAATAPGFAATKLLALMLFDASWAALEARLILPLFVAVVAAFAA
ncbi:hypothetical protein BCR37DRAFT_381712 [Protomyces lactucae-debilis]|uniref:Uncharacterized protein n=1 Tax=Protomyces lactucae-debilis TaxID=2754530 RepID=A0A1Y2F6N9_PROLT|nr:uncharacterized protein BCR37DRAFT_381712 [Protomyces lactucae-debilis]ORY79519.1 hypothetical protein BCR37DRAFT_381712 [Protomyces lactucae-debilis]